MPFGDDELRESTGSPEPLPNEAQRPTAGRHFAGLLIEPANGRHAAAGALLAVLALTLHSSPPALRLPLVVVSLLAVGLILLWPRLARRATEATFTRARERSRRALLGRRWRHVPDTSLSRAGAQPDEAGGLSVSGDPSAPR